MSGYVVLTSRDVIVSPKRAVSPMRWNGWWFVCLAVAAGAVSFLLLFAPGKHGVTLPPGAKEC